MIYVDANYWIYWFDQRLPEHKYVLKPMREALREGIVLNVITIIEVAHYLRNLAEKDFLDKLNKMQSLTSLELVNLDTELLKLALEKLVRYAKVGIGGRDSVILATMQALGIKRIATHDKVFKQIKGLEVIDQIP
ncbi:MAG: type II toxin-antitoxin system VapC family toxin [Candidatus Freyarchaeota archaeon]|nr:type II toxin-antitoxin system VapC family toxin [Candidatus Jordarchaeia archaeon]MBS7268073.1 type II toxin-antitoxin system VapC family toxin [Candidatus Jordarchaeia archaeon]MBS7279096.1 type II toxin-antitoxin system VapC family toxin [Candidatus Jordarchaeia archaeon]